MRVRFIAVVFLAIVSVIRGAVIVTWPPEPIPRLLNWNYELDVDGNLSADIIFHSNSYGFRLYNINDSAVLSYGAGALDANSFVAPLEHGDYIGNDLAGTQIWHDTEGSAVFNSYMSVGPGEVLYIGLWPPEGGIGYFGLRFYINDEVHYGWVLIDYTMFGEIVAWAYESDPDTPILAGAFASIPEPGTLALLLAGGGMVLAGRRKRIRKVD